MFISDSIKYIGVDDKTIDLFESQYIVKNGVSYNSYLILDEKTALMDTVDPRGTEEWSKNLEKELAGRKLDYIVVQHMEPDHSGSLACAIEKYPEAKIVGNAKTFQYIGQFFDADISERKVEVKEGDEISLGSHTLKFVMAPMVHWPEVMVTYELSEKVLFSADGFGKFGSLDTDEEWAGEARRYYINIVGKYGAQVQALLKKAAGLQIEKILPLHGPILTENLGYYLDLYNTWSSYKSEEKGVFIAYASIHGHTRKAAEILADKIRSMGESKVVVADLSRTDISKCVEDAFRYDRMVLCAATYDGGAFVPMEDFLHHLQIKTYRNRTVGLLENGTWAPMAAKAMRGYLESMKDIKILDETVSIKSRYTSANEETMDALAKAIVVAGI
ncbi:FprA family A-type flavoprotein [Lachnospiraceae bacterium C1.1]|nr:FprA family A-type flavoprotein [Lachnospiraceae bacterium C1.1]